MLPASFSAFFTPYRKSLLLGGGLVVFALLALLLTNVFIKPGESAEVAVPITAAQPSRTALPFPSVSTDVARRQIKFVTCLCRDTQGDVWIGTEDAGLWRYDPDAPVTADYVHFAAADGLGDENVYTLACDKSGRVWAGTLNHGVAVFNGKAWKSYAPPNGPLGCRVFALAVNPISGGVWMATEAGLARYEQKRWRYYTHADGLPTGNATALAFAPNGTLYVGTECDGIAIGSPASDFRTWRIVPGPASPPHAMRGAGLPSGLINCLLVTRDGEVWAGTTAGLAHSADGGRAWRFRRGSDWKEKVFGRFTSGYAAQPQISGIEVKPAFGSAFAIHASGGSAGRFLAERGFTGGQAEATEHPIDITRTAAPAPQSVYQTGRVGNCQFTASHQKPNTLCQVRLHFVETVYHAPGQRIFDVFINGKRVLDHFDIFKAAGTGNRAVVHDVQARTDAQGQLHITFANGTPGWDGSGLGEDYVTCLADDNAGHLLLGYRGLAPEALDLKTGERQYLGANVYVKALLPLNSGTALVGNYGEGLSSLPVTNLHSPNSYPPTLKIAAALPAPPAPPNLVQLNSMIAETDRVTPNPQENRPYAAALPDDWLTQGDWLGRYGRYWAVLAAFFHPIPEDYVWGAGWEPVDYKITVGPNHDSGDSLRYYLQSRYSDDPRVLEMPAAYTHSRVLKHYTSWTQDRRETEWDDHGEAYSQSMEGPDIYATLTIPKGLYYFSLYELNKDGHNEFNWLRDYRISVRTHSGTSLEDVKTFETQAELAHGRVRDFWGGVWKRFLVRGPLILTLKVSRNNSLNATLPALMLDLVDENAAPYFQTVDQWNYREALRERERVVLTQHPTKFSPANSEAEAADRLFSALNEKRLTNSVWWATGGRRSYAALQRWYTHAFPKSSIKTRNKLNLKLAACEYQLGCYPEWEKWQQAAGLTTARQIEKSLRWDGVTNSYSGLGGQIVSAYRSERSGRKVSQGR